jgi:hypothetical protein
MALRDLARRRDSQVLGRTDLAAQLARLEAFRDLAPGWDSYDAPPPNETALRSARNVLRLVQEQEDVPAVHVAPSAEGGVLVVFSGDGPKYADIECFNDGEVLAILSAPEGEPTIWPLDPEKERLQAALARIAAFLDD